MEREILYRGKRKDNGEWIENLTLFQLDENLYMLQTAWAYITYDLQYNITAILGRKKPFLVEVIPSTVGRYTGLTDKNGVKIFEGDICRFQNVFSKPHIGVVRYYANAKPISDDGQCSVDLAECNSEDLEVIENIHDNPGMLGGK